MGFGAMLAFGFGFVLLVVGAHYLVKGAARLALGLGVSPLVVGLTVVAYGTSAPELAVSVEAALAGRADIALGNVVGSNILNVLLVLGGSALIAPLLVARQLVRLDVPILIGLSGLVYGLSHSGRIGRAEGALLLALAVAYTLFTIRTSRRSDPPDVQEQLEATAARGSGTVAASLILVALGLVLLVLGARFLVDAAVQLARGLGVSELLIGLTIVAVGTSLPEIATSFIAAARGQRDIAVGNVVGSNIFNLAVVLGGAALAAPAGVEVSAAALAFDLPLMLAVAAACLPVFATGHCIARWEGGFFLACYAAYTAYLVSAARAAEAAPDARLVLQAFVLVLGGVTLGALVWDGRRGRGSAGP